LEWGLTGDALMPKAALFRRLAFAACVAALSAGAPAVARPVVQAQAAAPDGLAIPAVVAWLGEKGLTAGAVQTDGAQPYVRVTDGPLTWVLYFYSCQGQGERQVCPDLQFSAAFTNATVTPEITNRWNRENRFLKAFYQPGSAGGAGAAVAQLDVLVDSRSGLTELEDAVAVWRGLLPQFAREVGFLTGPAQP
ncbi:YbjN domain-containing protein, partial [Brevundimonas sp.]|uniref:YbjN domain-containing protein n=1 Tax=Brevundimonas sp. TaxID=1871086 RepID=UPI0025C164F4